MPDQFCKDALEAHNRYRSLHQASDLNWSRLLEKDAQSWANQLAKEGRLRHDNTDDGENLYAVFGKGNVSGDEVVDLWFKEVDKYDFRSPGFKSDTGHFTQIVWQDTKELGIGQAKSADGKIFVVARYRPAGNFINHFQDNVKPRKSSSDSNSIKAEVIRRTTRDQARKETFLTSNTAASLPTSTFSKQSLDTHNKFRTLHGVSTLTWAEDLADEAEAYARKLAQARTLQHASKNERKGTGENLAYFTGNFDTAAERATTLWYEEVNDYDFLQGGWQSGTGHFTQVVWKNTKELGMGRAKTADGKITFVVGRYRPAGNVINFMADNVFPKEGE
ncbi:uncharacterized protein [Montipora capricornis]|uniref:uncharacterized protein isoform X2 n=1 Tax=Montipora foliosa TaxID=591990 RepID=UPI0035F136BA